ncbi:hypothetical protein HYZ70_02575 [Candidatus Curtissbacteria bacterium]|nr:hypothetical protein [Candidatus Curtissbacteria bacterium]
MSGTQIKLYYQIFPVINSAGKEIGEIARPIVKILLNYKHGKMIGPFSALLDSGSDYNLFPAEVAIALGINLRKGIEKINEGIGRRRVKTYRHSGIKVFLEGHSFETTIDFGEGISVPLFGQQGFFDKFRKITFNRKEEEIVITI